MVSSVFTHVTFRYGFLMLRQKTVSAQTGEHVT